MPFLRPIVVRIVTLVAVVAAALGVVAPSPTHAEDVRPSRAAALDRILDAGRFCPRPIGEPGPIGDPRHDGTAVDCTGLLAGETADGTVDPELLSRLNFGDLPAFAEVDVEAIDTAVAAYVQRLADAAAEEAARRAAAAGRGNTRSTTPVRAPSAAQRTVPTFAQLDHMMRTCGVGPDHAGALGEHACIAAMWERLTGSDGVPAPAPGPDEVAGLRDPYRADGSVDAAMLSRINDELRAAVRRRGCPAGEDSYWETTPSGGVRFVIRCWTSADLAEQARAAEEFERFLYPDGREAAEAEARREWEAVTEEARRRIAEECPGGGSASIHSSSSGGTHITIVCHG